MPPLCPFCDKRLPGFSDAADNNISGGASSPFAMRPWSDDFCHCVKMDSVSVSPESRTGLFYLRVLRVNGARHLPAEPSWRVSLSSDVADGPSSTDPFQIITRNLTTVQTINNEVSTESNAINQNESTSASANNASGGDNENANETTTSKKSNVQGNCTSIVVRTHDYYGGANFRLTLASGDYQSTSDFTTAGGDLGSVVERVTDFANDLTDFVTVMPSPDDPWLYDPEGVLPTQMQNLPENLPNLSPIEQANLPTPAGVRTADGTWIAGSSTFPMRYGNCIAKYSSSNDAGIIPSGDVNDDFNTYLPAKRADGSFLPVATMFINEKVSIECELLFIPDHYLPTLPDGTTVFRAAVDSGAVELVRALLSMNCHDRVSVEQQNEILHSAIKLDGAAHFHRLRETGQPSHRSYFLRNKSRHEFIFTPST